jgi:alpha-2-macroglobulin-like protein
MKKRTSYKILLIIALLSVSLFSFVQVNNWIGELNKLLDEYNQKVPDEKVYLHIDKTLLRPGEDLWFAAYITSGCSYKPTSVSGSLRVELIDPKGNVCKSLFLKITNGKAGGSFYIDNGMAGGIYKIRACTQWLKNWKDKCAFEKEIIVQKIVTPRLLMKIDFQKEAYGPGDTVRATLNLRNLKNEPVKNYPVSYTAMIDGEKYLVTEGLTTNEGNLQVMIPLPARLSSEDGIINASLDYDGSTESISRSIPIILNKITLSFFPEGGDLLSGFNNRIAFKALNANGKPADIKGVIIDEMKNEVASFESFHQGMGAVWFTPEKGHQYFARILNPTGIDTLFLLPEALDNGFMLNITGKNDRYLQTEITSVKQAPVRIIAQVMGKIYFSQEMLLNPGKNNLSIPVENFPAGVAQVTLFDDNGIPRCERLVFINSFKNLRITITSNKEKYAPREKVNLRISATDENNKPVSANLSLAVVNDQILSYANDKQDNILSYMWLSSDVTGEIYEPSFYFDKNEPKREEALDYLLMTQGWRRFKWEDVTNKNYNITYLPDYRTLIAGQVRDNFSGKGVRAKIGIISECSKISADEIITDENGFFSICNLDPAATVTLYAHSKKVNCDNLVIKLDEEATTYSTKRKRSATLTDQYNNVIPEVLKQSALIIDNEAIYNKLKNGNEVTSENNNGKNNSSVLVMDENSQALDEVITVGYGLQRKDLTTSSIQISRSGEEFSPGESLQGKIAGISIMYSYKPKSENNLQIRGRNSLLYPDPLYVIDYVPVFESTSYLLNQMNYLSSSDIKSMTIIKTPDPGLSYGFSGGNGVVMIESKDGSPNNYYYPHYKRYSRLTLFPANNYDAVKEFYVPQYKPHHAVLTRTDFRSTVFWKNELKTDAEGTANVEFYNSDEITTFRVIAEGISDNDLIGHQEFNYYTQRPVSLSVKLPAYCTNIDTVYADAVVRNNTGDAIQGTLDAILPDNIKLAEPYDSSFTIQAMSVKHLLVKLKPESGKTESSNITFCFHSAAFSDAVSQETEIVPYGFPVESSFGGIAKENTFIIDVGKTMSGTLKAEFNAFPSVISDLQAGMESVFREPHGCFEQVSATTYPSILTLKFLRETGKTDRNTERKALEYIKEGYKMLAGYETSEHGFEWYGHTPPHEGLSAYGLLELIEMKDVYPDVSDELIERTRKWLLSRKKGDGTFKLTSGKYGFSAAPKEVSNAFIVYALAESGLDLSVIEPEFRTALEECTKSLDSYRLALMANASFDFKEDDRAQLLMTYLKEQLSAKGPGGLPVDQTIVQSFGKSAQVETVSLILLAELKSNRPNFNLCFKLVSFLAENRKYGGFGNTQSTTMALKALTRYAELIEKSPSEFRVNIWIGDRLAESRTYSKGINGNISIPDLEKYMVDGKNIVRVKIDSLDGSVPYSFDLQWRTATPVNNNLCPLSLKTDLSNEKIKLGETVRLTTVLSNKNNKGLPMTVVLLGIPGGLTPQPWQLKELLEKEQFDYYEIHRNYLVLYYRELGPGEERTINLDLKSEVKGTFTAPANAAYIYYNDENKTWIPGKEIVIE